MLICFLIWDPKQSYKFLFVGFVYADTQILVVFTKMFKKARDENEHQAEAEKKKMEKEAQKEQAANSSAKKESVDADRPKFLKEIKDRFHN